MKNHINILRATRKNYLKALEGVPVKLLNKVPEGFNNNLIWNAAHAVVTQQLLCYSLAGLASRLPGEIIEAYRKGSRPGKEIDQAAVEQIMEWLSAGPDWLEKDLAEQDFKNFREYPTSYGYTVSSIEDAIAFNNVHEGMHLGYIIALKKQLKI